MPAITGTIPARITVSLPEMTAELIRDSLLSLPDEERTFIITGPGSGDFRIISIERKASGEIEIKYSDVPEA